MQAPSSIKSAPTHARQPSPHVRHLQPTCRSGAEFFRYQTACPPIAWERVIGIGVYHLAALLAFVPYFFSWTGVVLAFLGYSLLTILGINIGYHRLLAHRGLTCSKRIEHVLAFLGLLALQFGPAYWVAIHRRHHHFADRPEDPHAPVGNFLWSHFGWILVHGPNANRDSVLRRYARDLVKDDFYVWMEKQGRWFWLIVLLWSVFFIAGWAVELVAGGTMQEAIQFGASLLVWGVFVRTVIVWHVTWSVNSWSHHAGYRTYETADDSRNNVLVGLLAHGEGWHNNHHAHPRYARHGRRWWEIDTTWWVIKAMAWLGLVTDVVLPTADEE
ncbi:MAG: fatty acid desaturase [Proteobacteria bacterium]|nr:fatty acid desaturase [Pseudomonadota bacterium]